MKFYFSGLQCKNNRVILEKAQIKRVLVNPNKIHLTYSFPKVALDSNAYYHFRHGNSIDIEKYLEIAIKGNFVWYSAPDVINNAEQTYQNWLKAKQWLTERYGNNANAPINLIPI